MTNPVNRELTEALVGVLKTEMTDLVLRALGNLEPDGPVARLGVNLAEGWMARYGPERTGNLIWTVMHAVDHRTGVVDIDALPDEMGAEELSKLTEVLQQAEADSLLRQKRWAINFGSALHSIGVIAKVAIGLAVRGG